MPALLSVNLNKVALLRNSRGRSQPDMLRAAAVVIDAGAAGITLHPRRDERHVRPQDVVDMAAYLRKHHPSVELNVECEDHPTVLQLVLDVRPAQCTLVPVTPGEVTSDHGWSMPGDIARLRPTVDALKNAGIRTSCFAECDADTLGQFAQTGVDRVELYTGPYAWAWGTDKQAAEQQRIVEAATAATRAGLGVNAGHDLDRHNLVGIANVDALLEVSIGHALTCRALDVGLTAAVQELNAALGHPH